MTKKNPEKGRKTIAEEKKSFSQTLTHTYSHIHTQTDTDREGRDETSQRDKAS